MKAFDMTPPLNHETEKLYTRSASRVQYPVLRFSYRVYVVTQISLRCRRTGCAAS